jgi:sec-independent protein translocase protein TatB
MFGFDVGKLLIVGVIALVVIGPKELPATMRAVAQVLRRVSRLRDEIQHQFRELAKEAGLEDIKRDLDEVGSSAKLDFANDPGVAMRGHLPGRSAEATSEAIKKELTYASPEMRSYLEPETSSPVDGAKGEVA